MVIEEFAVSIFYGLDYFLRNPIKPLIILSAISVIGFKIYLRSIEEDEK